MSKVCTKCGGRVGADANLGSNPNTDSTTNANAPAPISPNPVQQSINESNNLRNNIQGPSFIMRSTGQAPETPALLHLWRTYNPPDLRMQRNEGPGSMPVKDVNSYFKTGHRVCECEYPTFAEPEIASQAGLWMKNLQMLSGFNGPRVGNVEAISPWKILNRLGAKQASKMHRIGEGVGSWPISDWLAHFNEEETKVFPVLFHVADGLPMKEGNLLRDIIMRFVTDHTVMRENYLFRGVEPPKEISIPHGKMEDEIFIRYGNTILTGLGVKVGQDEELETLNPEEETGGDDSGGDDSGGDDSGGDDSGGDDSGGDDSGGDEGDDEGGGDEGDDEGGGDEGDDEGGDKEGKGFDPIAAYKDAEKAAKEAKKLYGEGSALYEEAEKKKKEIEAALGGEDEAKKKASEPAKTKTKAEKYAGMKIMRNISAANLAKLSSIIPKAKKGAQPTTMSTPTTIQPQPVPVAATKSTTPLLLGAAGAGALYFFGAPILLTIASVAIGAYLWQKS